jgi:hypothetical protein
MLRRLAPIAAAALLIVFAAGCDRDRTSTPKTDAAKQSPPTGSTGGPGSTSGGLAGRPEGGTPGGAATATPPQGPGPGSGTGATDKGGMASKGGTAPEPQERKGYP